MQKLVESGVGFSELYGDVRVIPGDDPVTFLSAQLDTELYVEDMVETRVDSGAILSLRDMSTFVLRAEGRIRIGPQTEADSVIRILAGNAWINVKEIMTEGSMNIEMSNAVAGIRGTNLVCYSSQDGSENRVSVLRGSADVIVRDTEEKFTISAGQQLTVKTGGESEMDEFDVDDEQESWKEDVSRMGSGASVDEIPERLNGIVESESEEFARINELFQGLVSKDFVTEGETGELMVLAERFVGRMAENTIILSNFRQTVNNKLDSEPTAEEQIMLNTIVQNINSALNAQQNYSSEIARIIRFEFEYGPETDEEMMDDYDEEEDEDEDDDKSAELESSLNLMSEELNSITASLEQIREIMTNPDGQSQDWFIDSMEQAVEALEEINALLSEAIDLTIDFPQNRPLQSLQQNLTEQQRSVSELIRRLAVVEIDISVLIEMQEADDVLSEQLVIMESEINAYDSISGRDAAQRRLRSSLNIMNRFARIRRVYSNAQRLYQTTMRAVQSSQFRTSEQIELEDYWNNISDRFNQLGVVGDELESNIRDLESQLERYLD